MVQTADECSAIDPEDEPTAEVEGWVTSLMLLLHAIRSTVL